MYNTYCNHDSLKFFKILHSIRIYNLVYYLNNFLINIFYKMFLIYSIQRNGKMFLLILKILLKHAWVMFQ